MQQNPMTPVQWRHCRHVLMHALRRARANDPKVGTMLEEEFSLRVKMLHAYFAVGELQAIEGEPFDISNVRPGVADLNWPKWTGRRLKQNQPRKRGQNETA